MSFALLLMFLFMIYIDPAYLAPGLNVDRAIQLVGISGMVILMVRKLVSQEKLQFQWPESYLMLGLSSGRSHVLPIRTVLQGVSIPRQRT